MKAYHASPVATWPASDQEMWQALLQSGSLLQDAGGLAHLRETSRLTLSLRYARWLRWLEQTEPHALGERPQDRARRWSACSAGWRKDWLIPPR